MTPWRGFTKHAPALALQDGPADAKASTDVVHNESQKKIADKVESEEQDTKSDNQEKEEKTKSDHQESEEKTNQRLEEVQQLR